MSSQARPTRVRPGCAAGGRRPRLGPHPGKVSRHVAEEALWQGLAEKHDVGFHEAAAALQGEAGRRAEPILGGSASCDGCLPWIEGAQGATACPASRITSALQGSSHHRPAAQAAARPTLSLQRQLAPHCPCTSSQAHLVPAPAGPAVPPEHRAPHVRGGVPPPAAYAARRVKVAVRCNDRRPGQPRLVLQRVDVLQGTGRYSQGQGGGLGPPCPARGQRQQRWATTPMTQSAGCASYPQRTMLM